MGMDSTYKLSVIVNMIDQISGPSAKVTRSVTQTNKGFQSYTNQLGDIARNGTALVAVGQSVTQATMAPVKAIFGTQDALAELASLGIQNLKRLEGAATDFSSTWAGTTKAEFLTAAYDIKSGIASLSDEEETALFDISKVLFKELSLNRTNKNSQYALSLELWEYIPTVITATKSGCGMGGSTAPPLKAGYQDYLKNDRGQSPTSKTPAVELSPLPHG